jgi:hypothetical protein
MLAYYLMWHMKTSLSALFADDGMGGERKYTFDYVMESLKSIREDTVEFCGAGTKIVTESNGEQKRILDLMNAVS